MKETVSREFLAFFLLHKLGGFDSWKKCKKSLCTTPLKCIFLFCQILPEVPVRVAPSLLRQLTATARVWPTSAHLASSSFQQKARIFFNEKKNSFLISPKELNAESAAIVCFFYNFYFVNQVCGCRSYQLSVQTWMTYFRWVFKM